jgi:hypothetical protein
MATWRDIERLHLQHPDWGCAQIAKALGLNGGYTGYVRATFQRRGWANPRSSDPALRASAAADSEKRSRQAQEALRARSAFKMQAPPPAATASKTGFGSPLREHGDDKQSRRANRYNDFLRGLD